MDRLLPFLFLCFISNACSRHDKAKPTSNDLQDVEVQAVNYRNFGVSLQDPQGFTETQDDKCDSILWSCLAMMGGVKVNYLAAKDTAVPGHWFRDSGHTCTGGNEFSRDMALGLAFCFWQSDDTANAKELLAYADAHGGAMGSGDIAVTAIQPLVRYLFNTIIARADKTPLPTHPGNPDPNANQGAALTGLTGYVAHITMLGILIDGLMHGGLLKVEMDEVVAQAQRQPHNALYQAILHKYTDGDQSVALGLLKTAKWFPTDRLPASTDRSTSYLWQRDEDAVNWMPDTTNPSVTFGGTDFLFATAVIAGAIREAK